MNVPKVLTVLGVGCLVLVIAVGVAIILGLRWLSAGPEDIQVQVAVPVRVEEGQTFELKATVTNNASHVRKLVDVDIADEYLAGLAVQSATPTFESSLHVPIDNSLSHTFNLDIPPNSEADVTFTLYAARAGDFSGDVDFCIDSQVQCVTQVVRTVVAAPGG
jgi:hypothetical protein